MRRFQRPSGTRGQGILEYVVAGGVLAVVVIAVLHALGFEVTSILMRTSSQVATGTSATTNRDDRAPPAPSGTGTGATPGSSAGSAPQGPSSASAGDAGSNGGKSAPGNAPYGPSASGGCMAAPGEGSSPTSGSLVGLWMTLAILSSRRRNRSNDPGGR